MLIKELEKYAFLIFLFKYIIIIKIINKIKKEKIIK